MATLICWTQMASATSMTFCVTLPYRVIRGSKIFILMMVLLFTYPLQSDLLYLIWLHNNLNQQFLQLALSMALLFSKTNIISPQKKDYMNMILLQETSLKISVNGKGLTFPAFLETILLKLLLFSKMCFMRE